MNKKKVIKIDSRDDRAHSFTLLQTLEMTKIKMSKVNKIIHVVYKTK